MYEGNEESSLTEAKREATAAIADANTAFAFNCDVLCNLHSTWSTAGIAGLCSLQESGEVIAACSLP